LLRQKIKIGISAFVWLSSKKEASLKEVSIKVIVHINIISFTDIDFFNKVTGNIPV